MYLPSKFAYLVKKYELPFVVGVIAVLGTVLVGVFLYQQNQIAQLDKRFEATSMFQESFERNFADALFDDHLKVSQAQKLESKLNVLKDELDKLRSEESTVLLTQVNEVYEKYEDFEKVVKRNSDLKLDTPELSEKIPEWGTMLLDKSFDDLTQELDGEIKTMDNAYSTYLASIAPPAPTSTAGYSYMNVQSEKGTFGVSLIKVPFSSVTVKTVSAQDGNCNNNCPTKSLADYAKENNAFAGMNGTYFCPPDYGSCGGKINSFDYALYDSNQGKWDNKDARSWSKTGLITFKGGNPSFYKKSSEFGGGSVTAGISNYPSLVKNGEVVVDSGDLTSYQKDVRGPRGAIGVGGENIYLAIVSGATVPEAAYVMKALGVKHALNLDGGGSSAMYINGGYVVGPGRSLPNVVLLIK